jgi:hypothetical protein
VKLDFSGVRRFGYWSGLLVWGEDSIILRQWDFVSVFFFFLGVFRQVRILCLGIEVVFGGWLVLGRRSG